MATDLRQTYLERDILEADNFKLVVLLYQSALESLDEARAHLLRGEIAQRSSHITRVSEILNELALSVDHETGGELSRNLVELYDYLQVLLQTANHEQIEAPLLEARRLIGTLSEAWESCESGEHSSAAPTPTPSSDAGIETDHVPLSLMG
jgi:flagellar protein FliS